MELFFAKRWWWLESATNDVDEEEEVYDNAGNVRNEAREASAGDRRAIADAGQAGQLDISGEAKTARSQRTPEPPTDAARMAHNATHVLFRDWCPICVASLDEVLRSDELWWTRQRIHCRNSRQTSCSFEQWQSAELSHVSHSWKRAVDWWSASCAFGKVVIRIWRRKSFDILKLSVSSIQWSFNATKRWVSLTSVEKLHANETRDKNKSSGQLVCRSSTRTHSGTRTMLPNTIRDEHSHTAFSNFTCHSICNSLRWICALKIHGATRRQNTIPIFARNSICITFVHVCWIGIRFDPRSRSACSQIDEQMDQWLLVGTRCIVWRTLGEDEAWFAKVQISSQKTSWRAVESTWNGRSSRDEVEFWRWNGLWSIWITCDFTSRWRECRQQRHWWKSPQYLHLHLLQKSTFLKFEFTVTAEEAMWRPRRRWWFATHLARILRKRRRLARSSVTQNILEAPIPDLLNEDGKLIDTGQIIIAQKTTGTQERHLRDGVVGGIMSLPRTGTSLLWAPSRWQL